MQAFTTHTGTVAPLKSANVDTDQIIPKQFLQKVDRKGFGIHLFHDWRYLDLEGNIENPDFILNKADYRSASVLVSRENFGCGSSREHAPWSLDDFGFKVVIAPSFADIFYGNCFNIGMLPIVLTSPEVEEILATSSEQKTDAVVNLVDQTVTLAGKAYSFDIDQNRKDLLIAGLDAIGTALSHEKIISDYEQSLPAWKR